MDRDRRDTWKEIAAHLGVSPRTAQNYECQEGMPVHRTSKDRSRVWASAAELDTWKAQRQTAPVEGCGQETGSTKERVAPEGPAAMPPRQQRSPRSIFLISTGLALAVALPSAYIYSTSRIVPHSFRVESQDLIAIDQREKEIWRYPFPNALFAPLYHDQPPVGWVWTGHLDNDPEQETLFRYAPDNWIEGGSALYCFSQSGKLKWQFKPGRNVSDASGARYDVYGIGPMKVLTPSSQHQARLVVSSAHSLAYPFQVAVLNNRGKVLGEYWHSGHLLHLATADVDDDGVEDILLGGVNDGYKCATLVVLDPRYVSGASAQPAGDPLQLQGFGAGSEKIIIRFPRSCFNELLEPSNHVNLLAITESSIEVQVVETHRKPAIYLIYRFDRRLNPTGIIVSDDFMSYHRELESIGQLRHSFSEKEKNKLWQQVKIMRKSPESSR